MVGQETMPALFALLVDSSQSMWRNMEFVRAAAGPHRFAALRLAGDAPGEAAGRRRGPGGGSMKKVGVIGAGMTLFRRRLQDTPKELCYESTKMALDSAGITLADVNMVVSGSAPDAFDGVHIEHGNQHEVQNRVDPRKMFLTKGLPEPILNLPWGSDLFISLLMRLKRVRPYINSINRKAAGTPCRW